MPELIIACIFAIRLWPTNYKFLNLFISISQQLETIQKALNKMEVTLDKNAKDNAPQSVVTLSQLGGLRASKTPEAMPAGVWLLVGLTMLDRLRSRGQTKCNTPMLLMLATSVFGQN